jgi:hypothetical protein
MSTIGGIQGNTDIAFRIWGAVMERQIEVSTVFDREKVMGLINTESADGEAA